jgi:hypothetical protein
MHPVLTIYVYSIAGNFAWAAEIGVPLDPPTPQIVGKGNTKAEALRDLAGIIERAPALGGI